MIRTHSWRTAPLLAALSAVAIVAACDEAEFTVHNIVEPTDTFRQINLVASQVGLGAQTVDFSLINPWGIVFNQTGELWVANNGSGTATAYGPDGTRLSPIITIPGSGVAIGKPTGIALNTTTDFQIGGDVGGDGPAEFIFAGEDGTISAWNAITGGARVVIDRSSDNAVYTGIAIAVSSGANLLFATDFRNDRIDVYDRNFDFVRSFGDPTIPLGFAPFGIANVGGQLFVTYAKQGTLSTTIDEPGLGNGYVDVFNSDGTFSRRFAARGRLNSPWGIALAPPGFGPFGGDILIGNFGDGTIGAYNPGTGLFHDVIRDINQDPIVLQGLWGLTFRSGTLYFASGPAGESRGLLGTITPR